MSNTPEAKVVRAIKQTLEEKIFARLLRCFDVTSCRLGSSYWQRVQA